MAEGPIVLVFHTSCFIFHFRSHARELVILYSLSRYSGHGKDQRRQDLESDDRRQEKEGRTSSGEEGAR
jgi:hypothetical protein